MPANVAFRIFAPLCALIVAAASPARGDAVTFGAGFNASRVHVEGVGTEGRRALFGPALGMGYEFEIAPWLALAPEVTWQSRGFRDDDDEGSSTVRLFYLQAPVLLVARIPLRGVFLEVFAGPSLGWNRTARIRNEGSSGTLDFREEVWPFAWGLESGLGVELPLEVLSIYARGGYYHGITSLVPEDPALKPRDLLARVGVKIPL